MAGFTAAGAVAMGLLSAGAGYAGTSSTNRANTSMNKSTRKWQEYMDNTKYQRTVGDLKAAGLNPMLAYMNGAASPPPATQIPLQNELGGVPEAINSGYSNYRAHLEAENLKEIKKRTESETNANDAAAAKATADAMLSTMMIPKIQADTVGSVNSAAYTVAQTQVAERIAHKVVAETQNIRDENDRIRAATAKLLEETKNVPLTGDQIRTTIDMMTMQIKGIDLENVMKMLSIPGLQNRSDSDQTPWGRNIRPYIPDFNGIMGGVSSGAGAARNFLNIAP